MKLILILDAIDTRDKINDWSSACVNIVKDNRDIRKEELYKVSHTNTWKYHVLMKLETTNIIFRY